MYLYEQIINLLRLLQCDMTIQQIDLLQRLKNLT